MEAITRLVCLTLKRERFVEMLGPLEQLMAREKSPQAVTQRLMKLQTKGTPAHMPAEVTKHGHACLLCEHAPAGRLHQTWRHSGIMLPSKWQVPVEQLKHRPSGSQAAVSLSIQALACCPADADQAGQPQALSSDLLLQAP